MPEYGKLFEFAAGLEASRRGPKARTMALRTGMQAGNPDMSIYLANGHLRMVENKVGNAPLTASQKARHPRLDKLGHHVTVLRATSPEEKLRAAKWLHWFEGGLRNLNLKEKT